jgi:hypothetical protein
MRAPLSKLLSGLLLSTVLSMAGCSVDTTGASCQSDTNCPDGQSCHAGKCEAGTGSTTATTTGSTTSTSTSSGSSGSSGSSTGGTSGTSSSGSTGSTGTSSGTSSSGSSGSSGSTGTVCATPTTAAPGNACSAGDPKACLDFTDGGSGILSCDAQDGGCFAWAVQTACGALTCLNSPTRCDCPPVTGQAFAADPLAGELPDGGAVVHTGAQEPVVCRFPTLTEALAGRTNAQAVNVFNHIAPWRSQTAYAVGDLIVPATNFDGHVYKAKAVTGTAKTGRNEPTWPTQPVGAVVVDGSVSWELAADVDAFVSEPGTVQVPDGVTLRSAECAAGGLCDNTYHLVLNLNGSVMKAGAGSTIEGINLVEGAAGTTTYGIQCNSGTVTLNQVGLLGYFNGTSAPLSGDGLQVVGSCSVVGNQVFAGLWHNGVRLSSSGTSQFLSSSFGIASPSFPNGTGVLVEQGNADFQHSIFVNNHSDGLDVDTQPAAANPPVATAVGCLATSNGANGVSVNIGSLGWADGGIGQNATGVRIEGNSNAPGSTTEGVRLVNTEIVSNGGVGVDVVGTKAQTNLQIDTCNIRDNGTYGVQLVQGGNNHVNEYISNSVVHGNGNRTAHSGGGIRFGSRSTLSRFVANRIFANYGDQLIFDDQAPSGPWVLNTLSVADSDCGHASQVYCYDLPNGYGVVANGGVDVDARFFIFQNEPPNAQTSTGTTQDYNGNVTAPDANESGYCPSTGLACP